jgi:hypothetical protein
MGVENLNLQHQPSEHHFGEEKKGGKMRTTQVGQAKVNGRKSTLEKHKLTETQRKKRVALIKQHKKKEYGWRTLASKMSTVMKLSSPMSHEAARRNSKVLLPIKGRK